MHNFLLVALMFWAAYSWVRAEVLLALGATISTVVVALAFTWSWTAVGLTFIAAGAGAALGAWRGL